MSQPHKKYLKVGELAEAVGKTVRALHLYEEKGLLRPATRSGGGYRLYDGDAVVRVQWIDRLQCMGFSLAEIQEFLATWRGAETAPEAMQWVRETFATKLQETREALRRLGELENELEDSLQYLEGCTGCETDKKPTGCGTCDQHGHDPRRVPALVVGITRPEQIH